MNRTQNLREQRGQALAMALLIIGLGVGIIVPALVYASTGLLAQGKSKEGLVDEYCAESAIEYYNWRLLYEGYTEKVYVIEQSR